MEKNTTEANAMVAQYGPAPEIDLSKIKNIKASKQNGVVGKEFENKVEVETKKQRKAKFCFTEEHEIKIPTGGKLYQDADDEDIRNGIVRLQPMSLADEEIITNQTYVKNGTVFTKLLNNCILNNFDAKNFTAYDTYYLIYALRQITYGSDYKFNIECDSCGKINECEIDMNEVEFSELEGDETSEKTIKLPVSKFTITIRNGVIGDESEIKKLSKKNEEAGDVILSYVVRTIALLDDKDEPVNPSDFIDFFLALPGRDRAAITEAFKNIDGLQVPKIGYVCPKCGTEHEIEIPFTKEFFRY